MTRNSLLGSALVALQFGLIIIIAWLAGPFFVAHQAPLLAWACLLAGLLLGLWALSANRPGNFNIHPTPRPGGQLVQAGPYRWIRHPMYSAVLLAGLGGLYGVDLASRAASGSAFLALLAVLWLKAGLEEQWMAAQHPGYAAYIKTSRRFIPWLI